jgi:hypothetical protein
MGLPAERWPPMIQEWKHDSSGRNWVYGAACNFDLIRGETTNKLLRFRVPSSWYRRTKRRATLCDAGQRLQLNKTRLAMIICTCFPARSFAKFCTATLRRDLAGSHGRLRVALNWPLPRRHEIFFVGRAMKLVKPIPVYANKLT